MSQQPGQCPVCFEDLASVCRKHDCDVVHYECPRCGRFSATEEAISDVLAHEEPSGKSYPVPGARKSRKRAELSAWLQEHPGVLLTTELVQTKLQSLTAPPVLELVDRALLELEAETQVPGQGVNVNTPRWFGLLRVWDMNGALGWARLMEELGYR